MASSPLRIRIRSPGLALKAAFIPAILPAHRTCRHLILRCRLPLRARIPYLWHRFVVFSRIRSVHPAVCGYSVRRLCADTADVGGIVEYRESVSLHDVHQFHELHAETEVGLVAAVIFHGVCPWHTHERFIRSSTPRISLEQIFGHAFEEVDDVILLHKRHFAVNLCKFRLTVGTQVFVTEAFGYLEVTVETGNHQQLFQCLRALRQGIELSRFMREGTTKSRAPSGRSLPESEFPLR